MRLLLVEDNVMIGEAVRDHLSAGMWSVDWVLDLKTAFNIFDRAIHSIVLLDLRLPDGSGLEFLSHLRRLDKGLPVIILSAQDQFSDQMRSMALGADGYIIKPFYLSDLDRRISMLGTPGAAPTWLNRLRGPGSRTSAATSR